MPNRRPLPVSLNDSSGTEYNDLNPLIVSTASPTDVSPIKGYKASVNASATLATVLGEALPAAITAITMNNVSANTLYIQFNGDASTSSAFPLAAGSNITLFGTKTELDLIKLYTGSASDIGFITHN